MAPPIPGGVEGASSLQYTLATWKAGPIVAEGLPHVGPVPYILLRIGNVPSGNTNVQARTDKGTVVTGKLITNASANLVQQRHTPMEVTCAGVELVERVRIQFLNPDGTAYDFQMRDHSLALVLAVPQDSVQLTY